MKVRQMAWVMGPAILAAVALMAMPVANAQPGGGGRFGGGGPGGPGGFGANPLMLLRSDQVREALEIVDDQVQELDAINQDMQNSMRDMFQSLRDKSPEERTQIVQDEMAKVQERVDAVLLPHQQKRLRQIMLQQQSRGRDGVAGALNSDSLAKELNITADQKEKLKKASEEAQAKMNEKIAELRKQMEDEVLSVLTAEQRQKYKDLVGEPLELDMRQMFQRGGGNQGRGGGRGQQNRGNDF